nr:hypothetical protein Iba_chr06aCG12550 [Ipomoea batatas]
MARFVESISALPQQPHSPQPDSGPSALSQICRNPRKTILRFSAICFALMIVICSKTVLRFSAICFALMIVICRKTVLRFSAICFALMIVQRMGNKREKKTVMSQCSNCKLEVDLGKLAAHKTNCQKFQDGKPKPESKATKAAKARAANSTPTPTAT